MLKTNLFLESLISYCQYPPIFLILLPHAGLRCAFSTTKLPMQLIIFWPDLGAKSEIQNVNYTMITKCKLGRNTFFSNLLNIFLNFFFVLHFAVRIFCECGFCIPQASSAKYSPLPYQTALISLSCPYTRCRANTSDDIELSILNDIWSEISIE